MYAGYNNPNIQSHRPKTRTARRIAQARVRIPQLIDDIRHGQREAEDDFRSCGSLEEQLYQELRVLHRGRGPWNSVPPDGGTVTVEQHVRALSELEYFEDLGRQRAYELMQVVLARVLTPAA